MDDLPLELIQSLAHKKENHAFRSLKTFEGVDFFSNDYLGFAREEEIHNQALVKLQSFPNSLNGSTGSRLLSGNHLAYEQLEKTLCETFEVEAALVYNRDSRPIQDGSLPYFKRMTWSYTMHFVTRVLGTV